MRAVIVVVALLSALLFVPSPAAAGPCLQPRFVTSAPYGRWPSRGMWVDNNMWGSRGYAVRQTLRACSAGSWKVTAKASNARGDWQVKSYPNVHRDWHDWRTGAEPPLASFGLLRAGFATRSPARGIHNTAFDIWLDGVPGAAGSEARREVMVWTAWHGMRPRGRVVDPAVQAGGRTWTLWATADDDYLAFVPHRDFERGRVRLLALLRWLVRHGRLPAGVTLGQVGFGFEIIATGGRRATFHVDGFRLDARR